MYIVLLHIEKLAIGSFDTTEAAESWLADRPHLKAQSSIYLVLTPSI